MKIILIVALALLVLGTMLGIITGLGGGLDNEKNLRN